MSDKSATLFDHLKAVTQKQDPDYWSTLTVADKKTWSNFMIARFVSMNPDWIEAVNYLQRHTSGMDPEHMYKLYIKVIPRSSKFLKYVKKTKTEKYEPWLVELVATHYRVSKRDATDYLKLLMINGHQDLNDLLVSYGVEPKKIKKLKLKL